MRWNEIISERLAQERVHHNPSIGAIKALTKEGTQRFVISKDGDFYVGDAFQYTHQQIFPAMMSTAVRGYFYFKNGEFFYRAIGPFDNLPRDHDLLRTFERGGIHPMKAESLDEAVSDEEQIKQIASEFDDVEGTSWSYDPAFSLDDHFHDLGDRARWFKKSGPHQLLDEPAVIFINHEGNVFVWDGNHRIGKAASEGASTIASYVGRFSDDVQESFMDKVSAKIKAKTAPDRVTSQRGRSMPGSNPMRSLTRRKRFV